MSEITTLTRNWKDLYVDTAPEWMDNLTFEIQFNYKVNLEEIDVEYIGFTCRKYNFPKGVKEHLDRIGEAQAEDAYHAEYEATQWARTGMNYYHYN